MKTEQTTCDCCGVIKGEVNHWYLYRTSMNSFTLRPWDENFMTDEVGHVCGQQCGHKLLDEFFQKVNGQ